MKYVSPSAELSSFNCPHCGALAQQFWRSVRLESNSENALPSLWTEKEVDERLSVLDPETVEVIEPLLKKFASGFPFIQTIKEGSFTYDKLENVNITICYSCNKIAVWVHRRIVYPSYTTQKIVPNDDMPDDVKADFMEAGEIFERSPRGAAALLRLAIQKLCKYLGQKGKNINEDIAALVKGGLDRKVQRALDIVRVVGNSAVHPGQLDIRDDAATAEALFKLVNLIVERTISEPRQVDEIYSGLPTDKLAEIAKRDGDV